jgi:hypothetical protein
MQKFRSFATPSNHTSVDQEDGIIYGCSVAVAGEAAGHRLIFDTQSLRQLLDIGNKKSAGIKSRFTHPGLSEDGLGKFLGRMKGFRLNQDKLIGDLYLSKSSSNTPNGDLRSYILQLAEEDPASFGISVVVDLDKYWLLDDGREVQASTGERPKNATTKYPVARILSFVASDLVDEPALNPQGLFSASGNLVASNQLAEEAFQELDNYIQYLGFDTEKAYQFALRYFQSRDVDLSASFEAGTAIRQLELNQVPIDPKFPCKTKVHLFCKEKCTRPARRRKYHCNPKENKSQCRNKPPSTKLISLRK